jgi:hypothetical protein
MGQARGSFSRLVMDFETTFKQDPVTPAGLVMPFNSYKPKATQPLKTSKTITGTGTRNPTKPFKGNIAVSGDIEVPVDSTAFGYWLKAMFGAPTTTGAGPYEHVFKVANSQPSLVLEGRYSKRSGLINYAKHNGGKISTFGMSLSGEDDDELLAKLGLEAAKETFSGTAYDADPTVLTLSNFYRYQASVKEGGAAISNVTALDFTIDFGLESIHTIGSGAGTGEPYDIFEDVLAVTGKVTALFEDMTLLNKALNSTESSLEVIFTSGTNILKFDFNELLYERNTPVIEGPKGILVDLNFTAFTDDHADESVIVATLTNGQASY